jgi:hypothetical protein
VKTSIVLWKIKYGAELSDAEKAIAIALSIITGYVLHASVEARFRINARSPSRDRRTSLALVTTLLLSVTGISALY